MIEVKNLTKHYGEKTVFENLTFSAEYGVCTALTGASGIGKTTLMRCIAGLEKADSGVVTGLEGMRKTCVFQENRLIPDISVLDNILCFHEDREKALYLLERSGLLQDAQKKARFLSGGMKRRLAVVRALCFGGDVFFLDEPVRELDAETSDIMLRLIKEEITGKTAFLITHDILHADFLEAVRLECFGSPMNIRLRDMKEKKSDKE